MRQNIATFDLAAHIEQMGGINMLDVDQLKRAEMALLSAPFSRGLDKFLENEAQLPEGELGVIDTIGYLYDSLYALISAELASDPNLMLVHQLAQRRAQLLPDVKSPAIADPEISIQFATEEALWSAYNSASAAAKVILKNEPDINGQSLVEQVKASTNLYSSWLLAPLEWNRHIANAVEAFKTTGTPEIMKFDPARRIAVPAMRLEDWPVLEEEGMNLGNIPLPEGPTGCPISFDAPLSRRFYAYVVGVASDHGNL